MKYIRKIFNQDLTHQITANVDGSKSFFEYDFTLKPKDRTIQFVFRSIAGDNLESLDGTIVEGILHPDDSESRINGKFKSFLVNEIGIKAKDIIIFTKIDLTNYILNVIKSNHPLYQSYDLLLFENGKKRNHVVYIDESVERKASEDQPLQQIFYGAPGTGKSYAVNEICKTQVHYRTTFHPDSDYSTFVGCYKPTKERAVTKVNLDKAALAYKLKEYREEHGETDGQVLFGRDYYDLLKNMDAADLANLLKESGGKEYDTYLSTGVKVGRTTKKTAAGIITYAFTPQAFTKAYIKAWELHDKNTPVFLIIEEINRGNCAQIFGDLFQLLDRDEQGYSKYEISPDTDLQNYISEQGLNISGAVDSDGNDISKEIANGELMKLPKNLFIWATMNTSDQSLFPIDSAFKRRWDWKYKPINENAEDGWYISVNGKPYSWSSFLKKINKEIQDTTSSEDKMLGFYFCKAEDKKITEERFVSKVLFYLYNDVFKDYGLDSRPFFKNKENGDKVITFQSLYNSNGSVNKELVETLLDNLEVEILPTIEEGFNAEEDPEERNVSSETKQLQEKFWLGFNKYRTNNEEFCSLYTERVASGHSMDLTFSRKAYHPYLGVLFSKNVARTGLWFRPGEENDAKFEYYKQQADKIKSMFVEELEYKDGPNSHTIQASKPIDLKNENNWTEVYDWFMQLAIKYYKVKEELDK